MDITGVPISRAITKQPFDCGIDELNHYFTRFAFPNDKKNIGKTFIAVLYRDNVLNPLGYCHPSVWQTYYFLKYLKP
jgi:hypothetical protein